MKCHSDPADIHVQFRSGVPDRGGGIGHAQHRSSALHVVAQALGLLQVAGGVRQ